MGAAKLLSMRNKKIFQWGCGSLIAIVLVLGIGATWLLGPSAGIALRAQPFFLIPPSPQRYASVVVDYAEKLGIHGDSPEFAKAKEEALAHIKDAQTLADTHEPLNQLLKAAGGKHSRLIPPKEASQPTGDVLPEVTQEGRVVVLKVPEYIGGSRGEISGEDYANTLAKGIANADACGAVVDLRGNGGGDMGPMVAGLSPLLPDGDVLWFAGRGITSAVTIEGNSVQGGGTATSAAEVGKVDWPVAILIDSGTASSAEATLLSFRGLPHSQSFGEATAGYASSNTSFTMSDGAIVLLTVAKDKDRTGAEYLDDPIEPDNPTPDALGAALKWLEEQGCR